VGLEYFALTGDHHVGANQKYIAEREGEPVQDDSRFRIDDRPKLPPSMRQLFTVSTSSQVRGKTGGAGQVLQGTKRRLSDYSGLMRQPSLCVPQALVTFPNRT
jgi:hypothetical protein